MSATANYQFNTSFINATRKKLDLCLDEYLVVLFIKEQIANPENGGWCPISKKDIADYLDISEREVYRSLAVLHEKGLIERFEKTPLIRLTKKGYDCLVGIPTAKMAVPLPKWQTVLKETSPTPPKEINTPSLREGRAGKKPPSCPLLNGSPLKGKYPEGHKECYEYLDSAQQRRGFNFINKDKQLRAIHNILKAGFDFPQMNKSVSVMDKSYGKGNWDFTSMASFLEKGAGYGKDS